LLATTKKRAKENPTCFELKDKQAKANK